jgi:hypothetical protein
MTTTAATQSGTVKIWLSSVECSCGARGVMWFGGSSGFVNEDGKGRWEVLPERP